MIEVDQIERPDTPLSKISAVVHDTDRQWMKMLVMELQAMGVKSVHEARTPKEVLTQIKDFNANIVITHWDKGLITFLRRSPKSPRSEVPIILVTSGLQKKMITQARDIGINELIAKPASPKQIYDHIEHVITHRRKFVRAPKYIGPDRRRKHNPDLAGVERRKSAS